MTDAPQRQSRTAKIDHSPRALAKRSASYQRRLKAAGLDGEIPEHMDEFRYGLARKISMYLDNWHGSCPELICQRNRGCMAPNIHCANAERESPEEIERGWHEV